MKLFVEKFSQNLNNCRENERLTIDSFNLSFYDELDLDLNDYFKRIKNHKKIKIIKEDLDYMLISGSEIDWTNEKILDKNTSYLYGSFFLNDLYMPIVLPSTFWEPYNMVFKDDQEKLDLERLNYFQRSAHSDDGPFGCFYRYPMEYPFPIYFYDNGVYFPITVDLDQY